MRPGLTIIIALLAMGSSVLAQTRFTEKPDYSRTIRETPDAMKRAGFEQRNNAQLPLDTVLKDENGNDIILGSLFKDRPVILTFVYFNCPMLCNVILNALADTLKEVSYRPGKDYRIITISFNHEETYELAAAKKKNYIEYLGIPGAEQGWHFLTADEATITNLTGTAGFTFAWDEERQEYAHASGIMIATPEGRLSRYLFGIVHEPEDVRLGLVDASAGKIGTPMDKAMLMFCYMYNPVTGVYSLAIFKILKTAGVLTILAVGLFITLSLRQEKRSLKMQEQPA